MAKPAKELPPASGVDALIDKLRDEGVSAGRDEAARIVAEAWAEAKRIIDKASAEAKEHLAAAHKESDAYKSAGEEAVKTALRDTVLDMKARLMQRFSADVRRLTSAELGKDDTLKRMILELVGRVRVETGLADAAEVEVILPEKVAGLEELRKDPAELQKGAATRYVLGLTDEMLRDGVTFSASDEVEAGVRIRIAEGDITIELTDEAIAALLLQHLQPRFRAVLEGIVK